MVQIFNYIDYQDFLRDHYLEQKQVKSFYSYRYIENKTGISASYYARIILKKKNLATAKVNLLADFLELENQEKEYFSTLVHFNRAKDDQTADELFARLIRLKNSSGTKITNFQYFSQWQAVPMRELLRTYTFTGSFKKLGEQFKPPLSAKEAKSAFKLLEEIGMIAFDNDGNPRPTDQILTTGDQWQSIAVRDFQKQMIQKAGESIELFEPEERDITSVTIGASKKTLDQIRDRLAQARKEIFEIIATESEVDEVYQVNFQIYPLTKLSGSKKERGSV